MHWLPKSVGRSREGKFKHTGIILHNPVGFSNEMTLFYALNIVFALKCEHFRSLNVLELRPSVNEEQSGASRQWAKCKANELSIQSHREGKRHFEADFENAQHGWWVF